MANARGKVVDTTYLSVDQAEDRGFIHRDYIAHCLRWSHFVKRMYQKHAYETARILDVGCGRELPLAKLLYSSKLSPLIYYGVDAGPIPDESVAVIAKTGKFKHELWEQQNILELKPEDVTLLLPQEGMQFRDVPRLLPNFVTMFEVAEHVEPKMLGQMLDHIRDITSPDCEYYFSTPNWNRTDCAGNHVNEMLYEALGAMLERHGYVVEATYGTFASIRDYEHLLGPISTELKGRDIRWLFNQLREYYDTNFLSCIFAPLFPAQSRNALWVLRKSEVFGGTGRGERKFKLITELKEPWSSSANWKDMAL